MPRREFATFGDLLKYLRRRARLSQKELSIATGYSESQISRLEKNRRKPDPSAVAALFVPALDIEGDTELRELLVELAQGRPPKVFETRRVSETFRGSKTFRVR